MVFVCIFYTNIPSTMILPFFTFQTVITLIDVPVSSRPWRYSHLYLSFIYGFVYVAFQLIYIFGFDGEDAYGNPWIYPILDWKNDFGQAVGWCFLIMVILVFAQGFLCLLAFARDCIWKKWLGNHQEESVSIDVENSKRYNSTTK